MERFLGDLAMEQGWTPKYDAKPSGKRVLVIGGGPSGLSAAYHLTRLGHAVTIHEADLQAAVIDLARLFGRRAPQVGV